MSYKGYYNKKYPEENYHSFQFLKYYSFGGYTTGNFPLLFYGLNRKHLKKKMIVKYYKENGFVTSTANDWCVINNVRTLHNFVDDVYDHMFLSCDPNAENFNLNTMRCLYGKHNIDHSIEYTNQFWRKYSNNRKYSIILDNHGHEGTLRAIKYIDDSLVNFLEELFNDNLLKDTTVFLLSDHGTGMPSIYFTIDFFDIEIHLPLLLILVNDKKNIPYEKQYKYIHENQQTLITAFDIYNTFGNIIYGDNYKSIQTLSKSKHTCKSKYGISLFDKINPKERHISKYKRLGRISDRSCK